MEIFFFLSRPGFNHFFQLLTQDAFSSLRCAARNNAKMYLFYVLYVLSWVLRTQSIPLTSLTDLTNLDKIPFGQPCEAYGVCILIIYLHRALDFADH